MQLLGLSCQAGHLDSTSFQVDGAFKSQQEDVPSGVIHTTLKGTAAISVPTLIKWYYN